MVARFAVPFFFLVSGFFYLSNDGTCSSDAAVRKIKHILKLTFWAVAFYAVYLPIFKNTTLNSWDMIAYMSERFTCAKIAKFFLSNDPFVYSHLWFLFALVYCYLFALLFFDGGKRLKLSLFLGGVLMLSFSCLQEFPKMLHIRSALALPGSDPKAYLYYCNIFLFRALPFFLVGIFLRLNAERIRRIAIPNFVLLLLTVLGAASACFEFYNTTNAQFYLGNYLMCAALAVFAIRNPHWGGGLSFIGRHLATTVYVLHIAVGNIIYHITWTRKWTNMKWVLWARPILVIFLTLAVALCLYYLKRWRAWLPQKAMKVPTETSLELLH